MLVVVSLINIAYMEKKLRVLENNIGWVGFYLGLALVFVCSLIAEVIAI